MKTLLARVAAVSFCLLFFASAASSKAALSKLIISGGKLRRPVEVINLQFMQSSNPWFGSFIPSATNQRIGTPASSAPRYKISFYAKLGEKPPHVVYMAYYAFDPAKHEGFVYLPGPNDSEYYTNAGSIMRAHQDGRWNPADPAWCAQINEIISHSEVH